MWVARWVDEFFFNMFGHRTPPLSALFTIHLRSLVCVNSNPDDPCSLSLLQPADLVAFFFVVCLIRRMSLRYIFLLDSIF